MKKKITLCHEKDVPCIADNVCNLLLLRFLFDNLTFGDDWLRLLVVFLFLHVLLLCLFFFNLCFIAGVVVLNVIVFLIPVAVKSCKCFPQEL